MVTVKWCQGGFRDSSQHTLLYAGGPVVSDDVCAYALKAALGVSEIAGFACERPTSLSIREEDTFSPILIAISSQFKQRDLNSVLKNASV